MKTGILFYNSSNERIDIIFEDGSTEGGLHCGQTMEVKIDGQWIPTSIEMSNDWYLVGIRNIDSLVGLKVRL